MNIKNKNEYKELHKAMQLKVYGITTFLNNEYIQNTYRQENASAIDFENMKQRDYKLNQILKALKKDEFHQLNDKSLTS